MPHQVKIVLGIEEQIASVRRKKGHSTAQTLSVSPAECRFLLACIADVSATAEAIVHHPGPGLHISPWDRQHVVDKLLVFVEALRRKPPNLFIITQLDRAILIHAIERNPYFALMHDSDPRLTVDAIRQANALRERAQAVLNTRLARIPLGNRKRIA
jgi:hypothetical protein